MSVFPLESMPTYLPFWVQLSGGLARQPYASNLWEFYTDYYRPFASVLCAMERRGFFLHAQRLPDLFTLANNSRLESQSKFRQWASQYCPDAARMNVQSSKQLSHLLFGERGIVAEFEAEDDKVIEGDTTEEVKQPPETPGEKPKRKRKVRPPPIRLVGLGIPPIKQTATGAASVDSVRHLKYSSYHSLHLTHS